MSSWSAVQVRPSAIGHADHAVPDRSWNLGFFGLLAYLIIEYTRLPANYPILAPLNLGKVVVVLSVLGWLASPKVRSQKASQTRPIDVALSFLLVACLFSTLFAEYGDPAWKLFPGVLRCGVVYFLVSRVLTIRSRLKIFIFLLLALNLKMAQFVIRSFILAKSIPWLSEMNLAVHGVGAGTNGIFSNSADFGLAMCVVWPVAASLLFAQPNKKIARLFLFACLLAYCVSILVCGSRGAVVGAAASAMIAWIRSPKKYAAPVMVFLLLLGIVYVLPQASKNRFYSAENYEKDETANHRVLLWKAGLKMFADHPILGVGLDNFALVRKNHYPISDWRMQKFVSVAHSTYIQALSELGVVGVIPFVVLVVSLLRVNTRTCRHLMAAGGRDSFEYCLARGLDLGLVGYLVSGAFLSVLWYPHLWVLLGLTVGLHTACTRNEGLTPEAVPGRVEAGIHQEQP